MINKYCLLRKQKSLNLYSENTNKQQQQQKIKSQKSIEIRNSLIPLEIIFENLLLFNSKFKVDSYPFCVIKIFPNAFLFYLKLPFYK